MPTSPLANQKFKWIFALVIATLTVMQYFVLDELGVDSDTALRDSAASNIILALSCWLLANALSYYRPQGFRYLWLIIWCVALAALDIYIINLLFHNMDFYRADEIIFFNLSLPIRFMFSLLLIGGMAALSILWYNHKENQELILRQSETERVAKEIELASLREKLQPHFLFNSLNSISALIVTQPFQARRMVHQLSDFLRGTIKNEEKLTTLKSEIEHLELYLAIEKVRFGNRLKSEIVMAADCLEKKLPPMLLQPLVENAIKFGLYDTLGDVVIKLNASLEGNNLLLTIANPFDAETSHRNKGLGFGLTSVNRRLQLLYNRLDLIATRSNNGIFTTTLTIPQL